MPLEKHISFSDFKRDVACFAFRSLILKDPTCKKLGSYFVQTVTIIFPEIVKQIIKTTPCPTALFLKPSRNSSTFCKLPRQI